MAAPVELDPDLLLTVVFVVSYFVIARSLWSGRKDGGRVLLLPPSPPPLPITGNLHQLGRSHYHRRLRELARRHGPLFLLHLGSVPTIVVSSASVAEEMLKTQDHVFCSRPPQRTARGLLYGCRDVAFSPYGEVLESKVRPVIHLPSLPLFPLPCMMISFGWEEKTRFLKEEKWGAVQICGAGGFAELDLVFLFFFLT